MSDFLSGKIIRETKTAAGKKYYTVQRLRSEVRSLIKEANKILYDLDSSKKAGYMRQISAEIQAGPVRAGKNREGFVQMDVKYMTSKQLQTAYNALKGFIIADRESVEYAKRLSNRTESMRRKTAKTIGNSISKKAYGKMMEMWQKYGDEVDQFGYEELIDYAKKTSRRKESIHDAIQRGEEALRKKGVELTPQKVLKYLNNEKAIEDKIQMLRAQGVIEDESKLYEMAVNELNRQ